MIALSSVRMAHLHAVAGVGVSAMLLAATVSCSEPADGIDGASPSGAAAAGATPIGGGGGSSSVTNSGGAGSAGGSSASTGGDGGAPGTVPTAIAGATGGGRGQGGAGAASSAGTGGDAGAGGTATAGAGGTPSAGPTLPAITDPDDAGPFDVDRVDTASGLSTHSLFVPSGLNSAGKHPTVVWTCGNGGTVAFYASFLEHLASHGFLVVADKASTSDRLAEVESQGAAIAWLSAQDADASGDFFGKIDLGHIAVMGHSLGSLASFATAADNPLVATSVHISGGLTDNPVGFDQGALARMTKPTAFLCGGADSTAGPSCELDFEQAPADLPVFYGVLAGASHIGPFAGAPHAGEYGRAAVAWLRWKLADDPAFEGWFSGTDCTLCASPWTGQQKNLP